MEEQPNLNYFNQIANEDAAILETLISILKSELPQQLENYYQSYYSINYLECAEAVHKLKHKIGLLGLDKNYELAHQFEQNLRENSFEGKKEFDDVINKMTNFIKKL